MLPHEFAIIGAAGAGGGPSDIEFVAIGALSTITTGTSITPTLPSHNTGDFLLLYVHGDSNNNPSPPDGTWSTAFSVSPSSGSDHACYYKFAGASEANPTVTVTSNSGGCAAFVIAYRYVDTSTPMDVTAVTTIAYSSTNYNTAGGAPTIVPATDGAMVVSCCFYRSAGTVTIGTLNGFSVRTGTGAGPPWTNATGESRGFSLGDKLVDPAASTASYTFSSGSSAAVSTAVALRPA
jgi:hypothetical protein